MQLDNYKRGALSASSIPIIKPVFVRQSLVSIPQGFFIYMKS